MNRYDLFLKVLCGIVAWPIVITCAIIIICCILLFGCISSIFSFFVWILYALIVFVIACISYTFEDDMTYFKMISTSFKKFIDPVDIWKEFYETYLMIFVPDEDEDDVNDV